MRSFAFITIVFLLLILFGLWSPIRLWETEVASLFGVESPNPISGLQVFTLSGELEVFIDNELNGSVTIENSPLIIDDVIPGERFIQIKRKSEIANAYWEFNELIPFEENQTVVVTYNIGPSEAFSGGHIITTKEKVTSDEENLRILANSPDIEITIDDISIELAEFPYIWNIDLESQHILRASGIGYEPFEFTILPRDPLERQSLEDYVITVDIRLMRQPVNIIEE